MTPVTPTLPAPTPAATPTRYFVALAITVLAVLSQYFVPQLVPAAASVYGNLVGSLAVVYGIPIVAFAALVGVGPLRHWATGMGRATWEGLRWYGLLSVVALLVTFFLAIAYEVADPAALHLLSRPNPVVQEAASNPWFWVALSFVVGACEETIFRGWVYGYWAGRSGHPWVVTAAWTSAIFAGVHLYYGTTYGIASPLVYPTLFLLGFAFAATYQATGGNVVAVALLHGANDASGFLQIVSIGDALAVHYGIVLVGLALALIQWAIGNPWAPRPPRPTAGVAPWAGGGPPTYADPSAPMWPALPPPPPPPAPRQSLEPTRGGFSDERGRCRDAPAARHRPHDRRRGAVG